MNRDKVVQPNRDGGAPSQHGGGQPPSGRDGGPVSLDELGIIPSVVSVQKVGLGAVAWITLSPCMPDLATCGAGARALRFGETGQVPEIEVENLTERPVLIPAHLIVTGGWQTRTVERSVVVPARASARVPVKCVEAGRWAPRDEKTAGTFEVLEQAAMRTRWSTSSNMVEQLERHGRYAAEQSAIWQHVEEELSRSPEPSHTRSYEAYLRGVKRQHKEAAQKAAVKPPPGANTVILFPRGGGFWLEAYPTPEALAEQSDDLLADLFDQAMAKPDPSTVGSQAAPGDALPDVGALLRVLWSQKLRRVDHLPGTLGDAYALVCKLAPGQQAEPAASETTGAALTVDGKIAHLSIGGSPQRPGSRSRGAAPHGPPVQEGAAAPLPPALANLPTNAVLDPDELAAVMAGGSARIEAPNIEGGSANEPRFMRERILDLGGVPMPAVNDGGSNSDGGFAPRSSPHAVSVPISSRERGEGAGPFSTGGSSGSSSSPVQAGSHAGSGLQAGSQAGAKPEGPGAGGSGFGPAAVRDLSGSQERPKIGRDVMRAIYARARDLLPDGLPQSNEVTGYRLMRVLEGNVSWVDIRITGDGYAVLGSHDRCDLVLASDAGIWLRHMIAICVRLDDSTVGLRLIDLKTDIPFFLEDDVPVWSVTATGPFAIRLGRHVICGFPIGQGGEEHPAEAQLPAAMGRVHTFESLSRSRAASMETSAVDASIPIIRSMRARDEPFTLVPSAPVSQIQELIGPSASPNHVRVTLERGGMGASVEIPAEALDAGVLLGRALNCFDGGLRRIFCDAVSRAHVLLLREREEVLALDLCTTNGTRVAGRRIRRYRLSNDGSTLELGKKVVFRWHRRRTPDTPPPGPNPSEGQPGDIRRDSGA